MMTTRTKRKSSSVLLLAMILFLSTSEFLHLGENASAQSLQGVLQVSAMNANNQTITNTNMTFSPFDLVQLKANITLGNEPGANIQVAFKVVGPENSTNATTLLRTAKTDQTGIAIISFRLPLGNNPESPAVGTWKVNCTAEASSQTLQNQTSFTVNWPVIIRNIKFMNQNGVESTNYTKGQAVKVKIDLEKLNVQEVNATLQINITDSTGSKVTEISLQRQKLKDTQNSVETEFLIPENASVGQARAEISLYSDIEGQSVQVAEPKNSTFLIDVGQSTQENRDIALTDASLASSQLVRGQTLNITVTAVNRGNITEKTTIHINYNETSAGSLAIELLPMEEKNITYSWNTNNVEVGNYAITIHIDAVEGETKTSDNDITAGIVTIIEQESLPPLLSATSLYVLTLFIVGLSTFSALALLRWKRNAFLALNRTPKEKLQSPHTPATAVTTGERGYAKMFSPIEITPGEKTTFLADQSMQPINPEEAMPKEDKFTEELIQFRLHSLELIPLSARGIDISIQKIRILSSSKVNRKQLLLELAELDKIVESQMELMENEIDQLKEHLQKLRALSKNEVEDSALKTKEKETAES